MGGCVGGWGGGGEGEGKFSLTNLYTVAVPCAAYRSYHLKFCSLVQATCLRADNIEMRWGEIK